MKSPLSTPAELPTPEADALAHSKACTAMLREEIRAAGGWLSFSRFMDRVLYAPGLGYYAAGARKFGAAGDFITAPEISPLFGQSLARALTAGLQENGGDVLELGPGSGRLAFDMLQAFDALGAVPPHYYLLEVSADLIERQQSLLATLPAHLRTRVSWIDTLPKDFVGAIVANEVLDVVPVHLLHFTAGEVRERGVAWESNAFVWRDAPLSDALAEDAAAVGTCFPTGVPEGYLTEVAPGVAAMTASLAEALKSGVLLFIDYGFHRTEYYHHDRDGGTLMCHYRHYAHTDPFLYPGLQDVTAHVDFTRVAEAATVATAGLELIGYTTQAQFLLQAGIGEALAAGAEFGNSAGSAAYLKLTNQAQRLLSPAEMGETFKVIGFSRGGGQVPALARARQRPL